MSNRKRKARAVDEIMPGDDAIAQSMIKIRSNRTADNTKDGYKRQFGHSG